MGLSEVEKIAYLHRGFRGRPRRFMRVKKGLSGKYKLPEGYSSVEEVGEVRRVKSPTFQHFIDDAVDGRMAALTSGGLEANAVYVKLGETLTPLLRVTYFQPLRLS